jgi:hypothetical protein
MSLTRTINDAEDLDHRDRAAADVRDRAAITATTATETTQPMVPNGWMASGSYCVPGSDKAPAAIPKNGWCPAGWRESGSYCIR